MKKNSSTAHNSTFTRVVCMLLVTVLLCGLGWTGIVASAESMQAGSAVSEQIADNMTEGAVETEQPAPTEAPEHMGELPTLDEALGLVAAPQGQPADGVYYFGEQTDTEGLYVKVEVIDKSEGAVLPEGAQLKLKASEKAAEYVRQSILKKAELADDEFFFLYDLSFVDKDGKEIDVGTGSGKSFKVTVYMAGEGNNFADAEGSLNVVSLPYTIGELETAEDIKLEEAEKKAAEEPQTEDKPAETEPAQTEQPAAEEKAEPVTEDKAEEPAPAEEPAKAEEANEAKAEEKAEEKVEEKAEEKTEETEKSVIPARETKVVVSDLLKVDVSYVFNTNGLGVFAFYGKKATDKIDYQKLYDDLMACETMRAFDEIFFGFENDEQFDEFNVWLKENNKLEELQAKIDSIRVTPTESEIDFLDVSVTNVAPAFPAVVGVSARKLMRAMSTAVQATDDEVEGVELNKTVSYKGNGSADISLEAYVTGTEITTQKPTPVDFVLVLDQSGSMTSSFSTVTQDSYKKYSGSNSDFRSQANNGNLYYKLDNSYVQIHVEYEYDWDLTYTYYYYDADGTKVVVETSNGWTETPSNTYYTKSTSTTTITRQQALKDAATNLASIVADQAQKNNVDHRIAVVGFASQSGNGNNTEILSVNGTNSGSVGVSYGNLTATHYKNALQNMNTADGRSMVTNAINALAASGATRTDLGMEMAKNILDNNPVPAGQERKRVVIVLTDGAPTAQNGFHLNVANSAISTSNSIKTDGATVYAVGIFPGRDATSAGTKPNGDLSNNSSSIPAASNWFMQNLSSNNGTPAAQNAASYYLSPNDADELNKVFTSIGQSSGGASNTSLTSKTVLKDTVTPYFDVPENATGYKIYTMDCTGVDADGNLVFGNKTEITDGSITVEVVPVTDAETGGTSNTLNITGFDYTENWCGDHSGTYKGKKLIIEFTVTRKDAFIGGNGVPTNGNTSDGLYPPESDDMLKPFPTPDPIDIPIWESSLSAVDKNVYLHGSLSQSDLADGAKITLVNNSKTEIVLDGSEENYGLDKWQNAYVTISSDKTDSQISNIIADQDYTLKVDIKPKSTGDAKDVVLEATAKINVFKPEITFNDTVIEYGETADYTNNGGATIWKHGSDLDTNVKMNGTAKPTLDFNYDPAAGAFTGDTPVKVTVDLVNADNTKYSNINADVTFNHDECNYKGCTWSDTTDAHFIVHVRQIRITVIKKVEGNFGDKNKQFTITVFSDGTLVAAENNGGNTFTDDTSKTYLVPANKSITIAETADNYTMTVTVGTKSYNVVENRTCTIDANELKNGDVITVTNTRNTTPDMGVSLDSLPYIIVLAAVAVAAVVIILRKRRNNDD